MTSIETLKAAAETAIANRRAQIYPVRPASAPVAQRPGGPSTPPRDWDGRSPTAHYGADGHLLPEVAAYRAALRDH